jgi:hypothetical protein
VELLIDAFGSLAASARLEPLDASGGVGAVEFDGDSRVEIVKVSYLLGEVVRGESPSTLHWGLGEANTAVQMQPVIRGFAHGLELSTMLVTSNLTRRMVDGQRVDEVVGATLHTWSSKIEGPR